jgi:hypothetical protein
MAVSVKVKKGELEVNGKLSISGKTGKRKSLSM